MRQQNISGFIFLPYAMNSSRIEKCIEQRMNRIENEQRDCIVVPNDGMNFTQILLAHAYFYQISNLVERDLQSG